MNAMKKILPILFVLVLCLPKPNVVSASPASQTTTTTPIQHVVYVMQQNHTFDNYFGTYPGANGIPADVCMPISLSDPANSECVAQFKVGDRPISDLSHSDTTFYFQYQNGKMNGFVDALRRLNQDGELAMGYFDGQDIPFYWNLADRYVLFDNYFSSAHTGSITNRMYSVAGRPASDKNRIPDNGFPDEIPTIFDKLEERNITWKYYIKDYDPSLSYRTLKELEYLPPQVQWVPLLGFDRFLDDPNLNSHIVDLKEYYTDLENGTLPAVSYVLLLGATEHPISDLELGQRTMRTMIQTLMDSSAWDSTAFFITYDDWGGWYDHVPPPQVDKDGYGFRVPALLVSAYARQGHIDHTLLDHTSVLKFIEENWGIPPLAERDKNANNILTAFDFSSPPRAPIFIPATREAPEPRIQPRTIVIYLAYGAAILFAFVILLRARSTMGGSLKQPVVVSSSGEETQL